MKNLSLINIANAIDGKLYCDPIFYNRCIKGAVIDSRQVEEDFLFFAVTGNRVDGHDYIDSVYEKKALVVVSEKMLDTDKPYILVESSLQALKKLAIFYRKQLDIPVVGITGSVGKTSTKEFVSSVLETKYKVLKTEGNFNNEIGLPLMVLKIRDYHEVAVLEMGISDFGEMTRLSEIAVPNICVLTNIGICHLENLVDRDGVLKAKSEIFINADENCKVILNGDDDKLATIHNIKGNKPLFYGEQENYECYCKNIKNNGVNGSCCDIYVGAECINVNVNIPGVHMIYNAMAAALVGKCLGLEMNQIKKGIESLRDAAGRVNIIKKEYTIIDDCYNANPVSMKASIDLLATANGRKIACLGDMLELGMNENELHYEIGNYLLEKKIDTVFLCGRLAKNIENAILAQDDNVDVYWFEDKDDLTKSLKFYLRAEDTVLIKASHSMGFVNIVNLLK